MSIALKKKKKLQCRRPNTSTRKGQLSTITKKIFYKKHPINVEVFHTKKLVFPNKIFVRFYFSQSNWLPLKPLLSEKITKNIIFLQNLQKLLFFSKSSKLSWHISLSCKFTNLFPHTYLPPSLFFSLVESLSPNFSSNLSRRISLSPSVDEKEDGGW